MFLSKTCTIPLVRCNFEQIKKTVELQTQQSKSEQPCNLGTDIVNNSSKTAMEKSDPSGETNQTEVRTSTRKRMIIDYKKFFQEYADEPPSSPKKK